jgi:hypothetical protein
MARQGRSGWLLGAVIGGSALAVTAATMVGISAANESPSNAAAAAGTITCPDVASQLPAVPASAEAEVVRDLNLLQTQINEAQNRLETTVGQGGSDFTQKAILGPLADKRVATIDRMATAIGATTAKPDLPEQTLATCTVESATVTAAPTTATATAPTTAPTTATATAPPTAATTSAAPTATATTTSANAGATVAAGQLSCPDVESQLPAVPAQAQAEVERNLTLLQTQITEANNRLVTTAGKGGSNFVQNAILGPLSDKRVATINRIEIAIGRHAARPDLDVNTLADCSLA